MGNWWDLCGGVAEMASKGGAQGRGPSMVAAKVGPHGLPTQPRSPPTQASSVVSFALD